MENSSSDAITSEDIKTFVDEKDGKTAHAKLDEFLRTYPPQKLYLGWNGNIYPKLIAVRCTVE